MQYGTRSGLPKLYLAPNAFPLVKKKILCRIEVLRIISGTWTKNAKVSMKGKSCIFKVTKHNYLNRCHGSLLGRIFEKTGLSQGVVSAGAVEVVDLVHDESPLRMSPSLPRRRYYVSPMRG